MHQQVCTVREQWKCSPSLHSHEIRLMCDYWTGWQNFASPTHGFRAFWNGQKNEETVVFCIMTLHLVMPPTQCRSCWWRPPFQTSPTGCTWDSRFGSNTIVLCVEEKFNRMWQQAAQSYQNRATRGASRKSRTIRAGVYVLKASMVMTRMNFIHILFTKNYDHVLGTSRSFHIQLKMYFLRTPLSWRSHRSHSKTGYPEMVVLPIPHSS